MSAYTLIKKLCFTGLLFTSFSLLAQQVKKIDCCKDINAKATIIINDNSVSVGTGTAASTANASFNFELTGSVNTSAGVYNTDGNLVRTLWGGVRYDAGCYLGQWDGLLDDGTQAPYGNYTVKVLTNNVQYTWEGVIGNNIKNGYHQFGGWGPMTFSGSYGYLGDSFAEGGISLHYFSISDPQTINGVDIGLSAIITSVAADDKLVYWACGNQYETPQGNFIVATKISDNTNFVFTSGINHASGRGATTQNSVIGYATGGQNTINSIAVQRNGNYLFGARGDTLISYDKTSGSRVKQFILPDHVGASRLAADNSALWAIVGTHVRKYMIASDGSLSDPGIELSGLLAPVSLAVNSDNSLISVCDNGTSQVKSYSVTNTSLAWTLGQLNGYVGAPAYADDKFAFTAENYGNSNIAYQSDNSFWVHCTGEYRVKCFNPDRSYKRFIAYVPSSRSSVANVNNPTRVFADELEFERDYSKTLTQGTDNGWKLKNVWTPGTDLDIYGKFKNIATLSNGHTYAIGSNGN
ncbi:MAG: hypothetical protein EOP42_03580, partial [Sphingobacteriaceae bacterium]